MDNIKNNISKNLRAIASAFSKLNSTTLVLAIIGSIFIGILTINRILANKETLKRIKEEHVILDLDKSVPHSSKEESKDAEKTVAVVTKNPKGSSSKGMPLKEEFISSLVDASSVNIKGENYQVFSSDTDEGRQILKNEMSSFLDTELYIKNRELQNICVSQKVLYQSNSTEGNKLTLCRKHPDMKKDRFVRVTSLLRNKKICKAAAISLTKLASKFIFTIPDKEVRYLKLCKEFTDAKDALYSGEWTYQDRTLFISTKLLGKDYFTFTQAPEGDIIVNVLQASKPENVVPKGMLKNHRDDILMLNYSLIFTLFPHNANDIFYTILEENEHILTNENQFFFIAISKAAQALV